MKRRETQKRGILKTLYTLFVIALPMISVYASGIAGFTMGDVLLVAFFFLRIMQGIQAKNLKISQRTTPLIPLILIIPLMTILSVLTQRNVDGYSIIIRIVRRMFYYISVVVVSDEWFDSEYGKKGIVTLGKIGSIYMFIQYAAYYGAHVVLHGYLPFLRVYHESYSQVDYQQLYQNMFRPTSFLLEPAHISRYLMIPLAILLFCEDIPKRWLWAFVISAAIMASTSGTGLIAVAMVWLIWILAGVFGFAETKRIPAYYLAIYLLFLGAAIFALNNSVVQSALFRITNTNLTNVNTAGGARFRGYIRYFELNILGKIIGMGYGNSPNTVLPTWFSGASYMLYGTGFIGFMVCIIMFIRLFIRKHTLLPKVLCIILAYLFFVDDMFMSTVCVLYLSFICTWQEKVVEVEVSDENSISNRLLVS